MAATHGGDQQVSICQLTGPVECVEGRRAPIQAARKFENEAALISRKRVQQLE